MARGRMISKAISLDEKVNALSNDTARLLFTWLITHLDCEGRMHGDATTVKSIVFPRRNISAAKLEKYLKELEKHGLVLRYSVNGNAYLSMPNFEKHQPGLQKSRESQSQIPPSTPELLQSNVDEGLPETKVKVETKTKVEGSSSISTEDAKEVFQRNLGDLSEDMETEVSLACTKFSPEWVIEAISEAVKHNKKTWAYVAGVLKNWQRYGKNGKPKNKGDPDKYVQGKYGHRVQR